MKLPAYPRTKPSGIEWLGDVPEHWTPTRLREGVKLVNGYPFDAEQFARGEGAPLVRIRDIFGTTTEVTWAGDWVKAAAISNGDILVGMDGDFNVAWWRGGDAQLNQRVCCLRAKPERMDQRFVFYFIPFPLKQLNDITYSTTVKHLSSFDVLKFRLFAPPVAEQRAIAAFLDRETGRVDRLVAKKRELIERLKEKRTALISRTVTRGLPPAAARAAGLPANPPLKPSTLDWLGDIQAHWFRTTLKRVVSVCGRIGFRGYTTDDLVDEGDGALALGGANLTDVGRLDFTKRTYLSWPKYEESPEIKVAVNDLVIGQRGTCGNVVLIDRDIGPATINPSLVLPKQPKIHSGFLCYWLMGRFIQSIFDSYLSATAVPMLSQQQIGNVPVCHPPLPEQAAIAAYLDEETAKLDALVGKVEEAVERLQEYRTALITAAVTGKIDVRKESHGKQV